MKELEGRHGTDYTRDELTLASEWVRDLARTVKVVRLYRARNPVAIDTRGRLADSLASHLARFGAWSFDITVSEIRMGSEAIVKPEPREGLRGGHIPGSLNLPYDRLFGPDGMLLHRDELRRAFDDLFCARLKLIIKPFIIRQQPHRFISVNPSLANP